MQRINVRLDSEMKRLLLISLDENKHNSAIISTQNKDCSIFYSLRYPYVVSLLLLCKND